MSPWALESNIIPHPLNALPPTSVATSSGTSNLEHYSISSHPTQAHRALNKSNDRRDGTIARENTYFRPSGAVVPNGRSHADARPYPGGRGRKSGSDIKRRILPPEILVYVFESIVDEHNSTYYTKEQAIRVLNRSIQILGRCCLVSKVWYWVARSVLYTRRLLLCDLKTARLLLRTLQGSTGSPYPIRHLYFCYQNPYDSAGEQDFAQLVSRIVTLCPDLWCLEAEWGPLEFMYTSNIPVFQSLHWLRVTSQYFDLLAPLLPHLPNLTRLNLVYLIGESSQRGIEIKRISPPTFRLKTLHISQAELSLAQYQWLLASSSQSLEYLEIQELSRSADLLGRTVGRAVSSLHVKGPADNPRSGDPDLVDALPHFPKLKSLRVSGFGWQWQKLLFNIAADLRSLAVTYSSEAAEILVVVLANPTWQPGLKTITVFYHGGGGNEARRNVDAQMEHLCSKRSIKISRVSGGDLYNRYWVYW